MPVSSNEYFRCDVVDAIAVVTLQQGAFALVTDVAANRAYLETLEEVGKATHIKGLIQGHGTSFDDVDAFEAFLDKLKGDAKESSTQLSGLVERYGNLSSNLMSQLREFSKPLVAAFDGSIVLEHLGLTFPFDLRVMTDRSQATFSNLKKGFPPTGNLGYFLGHHVGMGRAFEILITEEAFSAKRLHELGLVTEVVEKDQLLSNCRQWVERLSGLDSLGLLATRQLMQPDVENRRMFISKAREVFKSTFVAHLKGKNN
jgi:enoyl-CoA hydratase/carnithine racemase